ncbi:SPFH domain-containing protein [Kitasatospora purpeofusca]|uniref:SPFH domain-containing protein n=1 Tax=Kitasatospora purpeofusca TaxID=67352 RepID=UPI0035D977EB
MGLVIAGAVAAAVVVMITLFKLMWRVAEPNEALIISGSRHRTEGVGDGLGFRIVTGRGTLVTPGLQGVRRLSLDLNEAELNVECVTTQGIPVRVKGVVIFKVGDDDVSIANAARRFLDQQKLISQRVHNVFAGHLRSIVGGLTVEDMIRDRERLTGETRAASGLEMEKLGLIIDTLQIQEIIDPTGYIKNLAIPHAAAVQRDARIAQAAADRVATEAEQEAAARKAEATRNSEIQQASYQAEMDTATARARQAGPLADAASRQEVVVQETRVAELEARRKEQQLQIDVRKPADARAYDTRTTAEAARDARISAAQAQAQETELAAAAEAGRVRIAAEADADATRVRGLAQAEATTATGRAEAASVEARGLADAASARAVALARAEGIKARAAALAENQEAVVAQELAEQWPQIVRAAAESFGNVEHMVLLNGADGMGELFAKALAMGGTGLGLARQLLSTVGADGAPGAAAPAAGAPAAGAPAAAATVSVPVPVDAVPAGFLPRDGADRREDEEPEQD